MPLDYSTYQCHDIRSPNGADTSSEIFTPDDIERDVQAAANSYYKEVRERDWNYTPNRDDLRKYLHDTNDPPIKQWLSTNGKKGFERVWQEAKDTFYNKSTLTDYSSRPDPTFEHWLSVEVPPLIPLLGEFLTTTSRVTLIAPTGLGKTMLCLAMATAVGDGADFLHWKGSGSPKRVLYIEGEMSRRQIKTRVTDAVRRHFALTRDLLRKIPGVYLLSREEYPDMPYLDTLEGHKYIDDFVETKMGGCDLVFFDSIMSLTKGDERYGEDSWKRTLPWSCDLTRGEIGQVWIHHTGNDETHGHGTKTREWQVDTAILLKRTIVIENEKETIDLHFRCCFTKTRERNPANAADFADFEVTLVNDTWCSSHDMRASAMDNSAKDEALKILSGTIKSDGQIKEQFVSDALCVPKILWRDRYIAAKVNGSTTKPDSVRRQWGKLAGKLLKEGKFKQDGAGADAWVWIPGGYE